MGQDKHIHSGIHDYTIHFEDDLGFLRPLLHDTNALYIIDRKVYDLYRDYFPANSDAPNRLLLDATEDNKTLAAAEHIYDAMIPLMPTKKTKIVSVGGGITQDVSGFVASTFYRGLHWVYVPTTLLAQADSCMGSKTSLNYKSYKNILGTFYPPHHVHICASFTNTLAEEDFYSGMGEVVKLHVMGGAATLERLIDWLPGIHNRDLSTVSAATKGSLDIKWTYMDGDEYDQGKRNMLNYGHCFGHAIETATHYRIPHGQAVIIGMVMANKVALQKKHISDELYTKINDVFFSLLKSDYRQLAGISNDVVINAMKQDKKRVGTGLPLIMMNEAFELFKITDLTEAEAGETLDYFKKTYCN